MRYLKIFQKKINNNGNMCEILDKNFYNINKQRKKLENEYDSQFEDYRDINRDKKKRNMSTMNLAN